MLNIQDLDLSNITMINLYLIKKLKYLDDINYRAWEVIDCHAM